MLIIHHQDTKYDCNLESFMAYIGSGGRVSKFRRSVISGRPSPSVVSSLLRHR